MPDRPASSLSTSNGAAIRPLAGTDQAFLQGVYNHRENQLFAGSLDLEAPNFLAAARAEPWSTPMLLLDEGEPVGTAMIAAGDPQNRNGRLVALAKEPQRCGRALALYLRQAFWSHPLHRLYAVVPANLPQTRRYADLLVGCGFVGEGRLLDHLVVQARVLDLDVYGLLRPEFDAWCEANEPEWVMA